MKKKGFTTIMLLFFVAISHGQESCRAQYDMIKKLEDNSHDILNNQAFPLTIRIQKSKRQAKIALKLAYEAIEKNDCKEYSIIMDRIIGLEMQLGNPAKAKRMALLRLNKMYPNWKENNTLIKPSHLSILSYISNFRRKNSFYRNVRKNKGIHGVCGTTSYGEDVSTLLWQAESLFNDYGEIFCLRFLQSSAILINEDLEGVKLYWDKIYDLLIKSSAVEYSFEEIKAQYEASVVQKEELNKEGGFRWPFLFQRSLYCFEFGGTRIFIKTIVCPGQQDIYKRCQPTDCEKLKAKSILYEKIKEYTL